MTDTPIELDKHRGMAAQKATDIRRVIADVEANAKLLRDKQSVVEIEILGAPATSWPEAVAKARYVLNLYSAGLPATDTHHRDLVARSGGQGAIRAQPVFRQPAGDRHPSPRPRRRGACGSHPALGGNDLNKAMFGLKALHTSSSRPDQDRTA